MKTVDHIAFNVRNIDSVVEKFQEIFPCKVSEKEFVKEQNVEVVFIEYANVKLELIQGVDNPALDKHLGDSIIAFHHLAFLTHDTPVEIDSLKEKRISFLYPTFRLGASNKLINFINPKKTLGLLIELCHYSKIKRG